MQCGLYLFSNFMPNSKLQAIHCHIVLHNLDNGMPYYKNEAIITLYMYTQTDFPLCENEI